MNHIPSGARVGAISHADDYTVYLFGFGVYEGDSVPEGLTSDFGKALQDANVPNPCIKLDSGRTVYGCECWWGPEDKITEIIGTREVVHVDIDAVRASIKEGTDLIPEQTEIPQDPELTSIVDAAEERFPTLEPVKHEIEKLLDKYVGANLNTVVPTVAQDLLLELAAIQKEGTITGVTAFSVDTDGSELEVNLGIRFPNDLVVGLTFVVRPKLEKSDVLDA